MNNLSPFCLNCAKNVDALCCLILEQNTQNISRIRQLVFPKIITNKDYICQSCWQLVIALKLDSTIESNVLDISDHLDIKSEPPSTDHENAANSDFDEVIEINDAKRLKLEIDESRTCSVKIENNDPYDIELNIVKEENYTDFNAQGREPCLNYEENNICESEINIMKEELIDIEEHSVNNELSINDEYSLGKIIFGSNIVKENHDDSQTQNKKPSVTDEYIDGNNTSNNEVSTVEEQLIDKDINYGHVQPSCEFIENNNTSDEVKFIISKEHSYANIYSQEREVKRQETVNKQQRPKCKLCGCSILKHQSNLIKCVKHICDTLTEEVSDYDRACLRCWTRERRIIERNRMQLKKSNASAANFAGEDEENETGQSSPKADSDSEWIPPKFRNKKTSLPSTTSDTYKPKDEIIELPNYRRAEDSRSSCLFSSCKKGSLCSIQNPLRIELLINYNYYIPLNARACPFHLSSNKWDSLFEKEKSISTFATKHVEDIMSLLQTHKTRVNFDDVMGMDNNLFEYFIGITKQKFQDLINKLPEIKDMHRGLTGLVGILLKHQRNHKLVELAKLIKIPQGTLQRLMKLVEEKLSKRGNILDNLYNPNDVSFETVVE